MVCGVTSYQNRYSLVSLEENMNVEDQIHDILVLNHFLMPEIIQEQSQQMTLKLLHDSQDTVLPGQLGMH